MTVTCPKTNDAGGKQRDLAPSSLTKSSLQIELTDCLRKRQAQAK